MSKHKEKRQRGKNFSSSEELILLDLVEAKKDVLENKKSGAVTWKQKEECWEKLAVEFVSQTGSARGAKTLKDKYDNLKKKSKIELATEKRETYRTGGGTQKRAQCVSAVSERVASLIGDSATGLCNFFDSDFSNNNTCAFESLEMTAENFGDTNKENCALVCEVEPNFLDIDKKNCNSSWEDPEYLEDEPGNIETFNVKWNPAKLKEKKSQKLTVEKKNKQKSTLEDEKILLTKLQQDFYKQENIRAERKNAEELRGLRLKNDLLELEIEEKKKKLAMNIF